MKILKENELTKRLRKEGKKVAVLFSEAYEVYYWDVDKTTGYKFQSSMMYYATKKNAQEFIVKRFMKDFPKLELIKVAYH